jgi:membrane AbrB-like protein
MPTRRARAWRRLRKAVGGITARRPSLRELAALAVAALAGALFYRLGVPLAWVLGPLAATAALSIAGWPVFTSVTGRRFGQVTIGASIGLNISAAVLATIVMWLPVMLFTAMFAIVLGGIMAAPLARLGKVDIRTAYYAMMPGGLTEMANIGLAAGARPEPIALAQSLRVTLLVVTLPPLIVALDIHGDAVDGLAGQVLPWTHTLVALALGLAGVWLARLARFNNPWMLGALIGTGTAAALGLLIGKIPYWLFYAGQLMIGIAVGARFRRESLMRLPRFALAVTFTIIVVATILCAYAWVLSRLTGLDLASAALGASPGGFAEMAITAQTLHLSVGLVTAFHVVRAFLVNAVVEHIRAGLARIGLFRLTAGIFGVAPDIVPPAEKEPD